MHQVEHHLFQKMPNFDHFFKIFDVKWGHFFIMANIVHFVDLLLVAKYVVVMNIWMHLVQYHLLQKMLNFDHFFQFLR